MSNCLVCQEKCVRSYCSLTCSNKSRYDKNKIKYALNPKRCLRCAEPIDYDKRFQNVYCGHSCSARTSNVKRARRKGMLSREERNIAQEFKRLEKFIEGKIAGRKTIRRWLIKTVGNKCFNEACSVIFPASART